jgi:hypothetical protein
LKEERKWTNVETRILKVKHMSRLDILLPWLTKICFTTGIFEHVWPPREYQEVKLHGICTTSLCGETFP